MVISPNLYAISVSGDLTIGFSAQVDMDASDTATMTVKVNNGTQIIDIVSNGRDTHFSGYLIC